MATFGADKVITWVHASNVPASLVNEYERSLGLLTEQKYGVISHTLVSASHVDNQSDFPPSKKPKVKTEATWDAG